MSKASISFHANTFRSSNNQISTFISRTRISNYTPIDTNSLELPYHVTFDKEHIDLSGETSGVSKKYEKKNCILLR